MSRPVNAARHHHGCQNDIFQYIRRHKEGPSCDTSPVIHLSVILQRLAEPGAQIFDPTRLAGKAALGAAGGATSGLLLSTGTCAFELVKVRSQLEYLIAKRKGLPYVPHGTISGAALVIHDHRSKRDNN